MLVEPGGENKQSDPQYHEEGKGHLLLNIGKIIFLIAILAGFWIFFDWWLESK